MKTDIHIFNSNDFSTSEWFGGKTTQLYIYPENTSLKEMNFKFRLSTATIEIEKSDFTSLKDVHRQLLLLEGSLELNHENQHKVNLNPLEIDKFEGNWKTTSIGIANDFNLMTTGNTTGLITPIPLLKDSIYKESNQNDFTFLYLYKGEILYKESLIKNNTLILLKEQSSIKFTTNTDCILVHVTINI